jgi:hypothetical protein
MPHRTTDWQDSLASRSKERNAQAGRLRSPWRGFRGEPATHLATPLRKRTSGLLRGPGWPVPRHPMRRFPEFINAEACVRVKGAQSTEPFQLVPLRDMRILQGRDVNQNGSPISRCGLHRLPYHCYTSLGLTSSNDRLDLSCTTST